MARQILAEKHADEISGVASSEAPSTLDLKTKGTIITAGEIEKLLHEYDIHGKNDLTIDPTLAERIRQYLAYQEELDPLKVKLAERIYKPYMVESGNTKFSNLVCTIYVNELIVLFETNVYRKHSSDYYSLVTLQDFKALISAISNPYAPYIPYHDNIFIDILAYVRNNGGSYTLPGSKIKISI